MEHKKSILIIGLTGVLFAISLFFPNEVIAKEDRPELKWEQTDIHESYNYRGNAIICDAGDGYFVINNSNAIIKYNYDGEKVKTIIERYDNSVQSALVDGNYLLLYSENSVLYKYSLDGELIFRKDFEGYSNGNIYSSSEGYFISFYYYGDNSDNYDLILKLDKNGNIIDEWALEDDEGYLATYTITDDNQIALSVDYYDDDNHDYKTKFVVMDFNFDVLLEKEIPEIDFLMATDDGYLTFSNYDEYLKLDKQGNIVWRNDFSWFRGDYDFVDAGIVSDGYILVGEYDSYSSRNRPVIIKITSDGDLEYFDDYQTGVDYYELAGGKVIILDDDDYIVNVTMTPKQYSLGFGSVILKYGYKDYKITTKVNGKGNVYAASSGKEGDVISYRIVPEEGYEVKSIKITTASGEKIEYTDTNTFVLPNEDVVIEVEFVRNPMIVTVPDTAMNAMIFAIIGGLLVAAGAIVIIMNIKKKKANL